MGTAIVQQNPSLDHRSLSKCLFLPPRKSYLLFVCSIMCLLDYCRENIWKQNSSLALVKCLQLSIRLLLASLFPQPPVILTQCWRVHHQGQEVQSDWTDIYRDQQKGCGREKRKRAWLLFGIVCLRRPQYRQHFRIKKKKNLFSPMSQTDQTHKHKAEPPKQTHQVWAFVSNERWK